MIRFSVKKQFKFLIIAGVFFLSGCVLIESTCCDNFAPLSEQPDAPKRSTAGKADFKDVEKHMGTDGGTDQKFHPLALKRNLYPFKYDGFLIGIEKSERSIVLGNKDEGIPDITPSNMVTVKSGGLSGKLKKLRESIEERLNDKEVMFVSHILDTKDPSGDSDPYNAYAQLLNGNGNNYHMLTKEKHIGGIYRSGWNALENKLRSKIINRVNNAKTPYSHIIVMSTGWRMEQVESIQAYNHLAYSLEYAAPANFLPLYITFSWPSKSGWTSIRKKRNDADEIGLLLANLLVNHVLLDSRLSNIPKILIGHSFGARILTRALFSRGLIQSAIITQGDINTLIGLQSAFSFKRFSPKNVDNSDGYPYRRWRGIATEFVFTMSSHDSAGLTGWKIFSKSRDKNMMLGKGGWEAAKAAKKSNDVNNLIFTTAESNCDVHIPAFSPLKKNGRIIYVDASCCIKDHNDIYRVIHGKLMRQFIH